MSLLFSMEFVRSWWCSVPSIMKTWIIPWKADSVELLLVSLVLEGSPCWSLMCGKAISRVKANIFLEAALYYRVMAVSKMLFESSKISWSEITVFTAVHWHSGFIRMQVFCWQLRLVRNVNLAFHNLLEKLILESIWWQNGFEFELNQIFSSLKNNQRPDWLNLNTCSNEFFTEKNSFQLVN